MDRIEPAFMWRMASVADNSIFLILHHRILAVTQIVDGDYRRSTVLTFTNAKDAQLEAVNITAHWDSRGYGLASIRVHRSPGKGGVASNMLKMLAQYRGDDGKAVEELSADTCHRFYEQGELVYD